MGRYFLMLAIVLVMPMQDVLARQKKSSVLKPTIWFQDDAFSTVSNRFPSDRFQYINLESQKKKMHRDGILTHAEREGVFRKLNLHEKLRGLDEMDKDILVADAHYYSVPELAQTYRMLSASELAKLKNEVRKYK